MKWQCFEKYCKPYPLGLFQCMPLYPLFVPSRHAYRHMLPGIYACTPYLLLHISHICLCITVHPLYADDRHIDVYPLLPTLTHSLMTDILTLTFSLKDIFTQHLSKNRQNDKCTTFDNMSLMTDEYHFVPSFVIIIFRSS